MTFKPQILSLSSVTATTKGGDRHPAQSGPGTPWRALTVCSVLALLAGHAAAQDVAGAGMEANVELLEHPPQNLPGHEEGARTREPQAAAEAATEAAEREWFKGLPVWKWSHVTGDWGGGRTFLEDKGLEINASYIWDWSSVWSGGLNEKASDRSMWDVSANFDLEKMVGLKGATVFLDAYFTESSGGSEDVGDYQGISNIDSYGDRSQLAEAWYEQKLFDDVVRLKVGKMDANGEFAFLNCAGDFLHASPGFSPTIGFMPAYPEPAMGVVGFVYPTERWYIGTGWFDGSLQDGVSTGKRGPDQFFNNDLSSDWYFLAESGLSWEKVGSSLGGGRVAAGLHYATGRLEAFDTSEEHGSLGFYALAEQQLWRRGDSEELKDKGIWAFAQAGFGDEDVNPAKTHLAAGFVFNGICEARMDDTTGVYVSWVDFSSATGSPITGSETAIETYYKVQITPAISLTPDLQYIIDPSGDAGIDNAWVGQLRLVINF
jgi:porin